MKDQKITIFEDGAELNKSSPCYCFELNALLKSYYLQQKGVSEVKTEQEDIQAQIRIYERVVEEILDTCSRRMYDFDDLTPQQIVALDGASPKKFDTLYTVYGERIQSLIEIEPDCTLLVAGYSDRFRGLKTSHLFKSTMEVQGLLTRVVARNGMRLDAKVKGWQPKTSRASRNGKKRRAQTMDASMGQVHIKGKLRKQRRDSPGKTF